MRLQSLLILFFCILTQSARTQTIKNGDFETGNITAWEVSNPSTFNQSASAGYAFTITNDPAKQNNTVVHLSSTVNSQWFQFRQRLAYRATDILEKLRLSADVKIKSKQFASANLSARVLKATKSYGLFETSLIDNHDWQRISVDFLVTPMTDSIKVFFVMKGEGEVWFDNVVLEKIKTDKIENSATAKMYLDTAISIISKNALYKDSVDFGSLVTYSKVIAADAKTPADCYGAIRYVLEGLGDHHSFFQTAAQASILDRADDTLMPMPSSKCIGSTIGYLKIPQCMAINPAMERKYADSLKRVIQLIDNRSIVGWIVDDRDNTGGNCWPMLLGLGPILGDGVFERVKKNGVVIDSTGYWNGEVRGKDSIVIKTDVPYVLYKPFPKIALLMNGMSGSSGESVILSFKYRPKTKLFGEPSYGATTGNLDFKLSDGAMIFVCAGKMTDRLGNAYGGKLFPDIAVEDNDSTSNDEVVDAAVKWLKAKK